jgi:hypothetical protein
MHDVKNQSLIVFDPIDYDVTANRETAQPWAQIIIAATPCIRI